MFFFYKSAKCAILFPEGSDGVETKRETDPKVTFLINLAKIP